MERRGVATAIVQLWRRHQRWTDVRILWPECVANAVDREHAERAFRLHMAIDPAYRGFSESDRDEFVRTLP